MVINGAARAAPWQLAKHLERTDHNESVNVLDIWGIDAPDLKTALYEMHCLGAGARSRRTLYHANIDPREDERLTEEQRKITVSRLADKLGLAEQPYVMVQHVKNGREHFHVVWSRIDLGTMTAIHDGHNYRKHEEVAHELEKEFGHEHTKRVHIRDKENEKRPTPAPSFAEYLQAERSGIDPKEAKRQITECWQQTTTGRDFRDRLEAEGYTLARGDRKDFVLIDRAGEIHGLTGRRIAGVKAHEIRERMADIDLETVESVAEVRQMLRLQWQEQDKAADKGFTSAAERLRAEELERQRGPKPRLSGNDKDIDDAIWKLNQTMRTQLDAIVVGRPAPAQIRQPTAELAASSEIAAQRVNPESRDVPAEPVAARKPQAEQEQKRQEQAATPVAEPSPEPIQRPSVEVENPKPTPIPPPERENQQSGSFIGRLVDWFTGKQPAADRQMLPTPSAIAQQPQSLAFKPPVPIPTPEPKQRPSASLFVKVFGWLVDAYQRAIDRGVLHEIKKIEMHSPQREPAQQWQPVPEKPGAEKIPEAAKPASAFDQSRQKSTDRQHEEKPLSPATPAVSKQQRVVRDLLQEAKDDLARQAVEKAREGATRLRAQEERERSLDDDDDPRWS